MPPGARLGASTRLLGLPGCLLAAAGPASARPAPALADFAGTWLRANREADDDSREAALLRATESMSFLTRGATRLFLRRSMRPPEHLVVRVEDRRIIIEREGGLTTTFDLDRPEEGYSVRFENGELRRDWRHDEDTQGTTFWRFSADSQHLLVRRIIRNEILGSPTDYTTTYGRER